MATYTCDSGVFIWNFEMTDSTGWQDLFATKKYVVARPIPLAFLAGSSEVVQYLGIGNPKQVFTILVEDDDSMADQLESLWQLQTTGTLDLTLEFGGGFTYSNVCVTDVISKKRRPWTATWRIQVEFTQFL